MAAAYIAPMPYPAGVLTWDRSTRNIEVIYVDREERGKGVSSALLKAVRALPDGPDKATGEVTTQGEAWAKKHGLPVSVDHRMSPADMEQVGSRLLGEVYRKVDRLISRLASGPTQAAFFHRPQKPNVPDPLPSPPPSTNPLVTPAPPTPSEQQPDSVKGGTETGTESAPAQKAAAFFDSDGKGNLDGMAQGNDFASGPGAQPLSTRPRVMPGEHQPPQDPAEPVTKDDPEHSQWAPVDESAPVVGTLIRMARTIRADNPAMDQRTAVRLAREVLAAYPEIRES